MWCEAEVVEVEEEAETVVWVPVNAIMTTDGSAEVRVEDVAF